MNVPVFVAALIGGILAFQAILWTVIITVGRKRNAARVAAVNAELAASASRGERLLCGPVYARVRRGFVGRRATVALTNERVIVMSNRRDDIPLSDVLGVREAGSFNSNIRGGYHWLVFQLKGIEVGIAIRNLDHGRWYEAARGILAERALVDGERREARAAIRG